MTKNSEIAAIFYEMADILEMQNIAWKPIAYRSAARTIESLKEPIENIYKKGSLKALESLPNIGEALAKKIEEYIKTGKISEYEKLLTTIPKHMRELMKIPGLGAKRIQKLHDALKITTVKQLENAAKAHKIAKIPTFGAKSEQDILEAIQLSRESAGRIPLEEAEETANSIIMKLKRLKEIKQIEAAGSLRRKKPFVRDIDILASSDNPKKVIDEFTKLEDIRKVIGKGPTKATIILKSGIQADIRVIKPESWGAALFYFTGSKNYNIAMRKIAIKKGMKLNEYGLFDKKTNKMLAGKTEKEIADKLGVKLPKPEDRDI
ncbi:MAG: nucleotidyltransferase domain-containing protein [Candidatus Pacearchaeota archaeon]